MTESDVLTIIEVATRLRVHKATVYRIIERGELEAILVGTDMRVRRPALDAYLEQQSVAHRDGRKRR